MSGANMSSRSRQIRAEADQTANLYDLQHTFYAKTIDELLAPANIQSADSVLYLAAGSGQLITKAARKARFVIGIEASPRLLRQARQRVYNAQQTAKATFVSLNIRGEKMRAMLPNRWLRFRDAHRWLS
jgi:ubiquinone/menaquinone biosynthesis C-methylase UbiE